MDPRSFYFMILFSVLASSATCCKMIEQVPSVTSRPKNSLGLLLRREETFLGTPQTHFPSLARIGSHYQLLTQLLIRGMRLLSLAYKNYLRFHGCWEICHPIYYRVLIPQVSCRNIAEKDLRWLVLGHIVYLPGQTRWSMWWGIIIGKLGWGRYSLINCSGVRVV